MTKRLFFCALLALMSCFTAAAQQAQPPAQPLTYWYEYHVNPGKEDEFMNLVKTVGAPVRDKLMADGVVLAWGVEAPVVEGNAEDEPRHRHETGFAQTPVGDMVEGRLPA